MPVWDALPFISKIVYDATIWMLTMTLRVVRGAAEPDLMGTWFSSQYSIAIKMGLFLIIPMAMLATIGAISKGSLHSLLRTFLIGIPVAVLGGVMAIVMASVMQAIDKNLVSAMISFGEDRFQQYIDMTALAAAADPSESGEMGFLLIIMAFSAFFSLLICLELVIRQVVIYMAVLFVPLAFATFVWGAARRWLYELLELVLITIFSKFIIAAVLAFGFNLLLAGLGGSDASASNHWIQQVGFFTAGSMVLFAASVALPSVVFLIMGRQHDVGLSRKQLGQLQPINPDKAMTRGMTVGAVKGLGGALGGKS